MSKLFKEIDKLQDEIKKMRPLQKNELQQIKEYYRIGLTYSSNAIEGNSLTETETKIVLEEGITIGGKPLKDHFEAVGHSKAYDLITSLSKENKITESNIKELHKLFYQQIDSDRAGIYRKEKVFISGSHHKLPNPEKINDLMSELIVRLAKIRNASHSIEFAAKLHKEFVFIHPFIDGNGRVARLLMNLALLQNGYNIVIIPPILRRDYISSLEKAHKDDAEFIGFIAGCVKEAQKDYLRLLQD